MNNLKVRLKMLLCSVFTIIILLFSFFITGCSNSGSVPLDAKEKLVIGVVVYAFDNTWISNLRNKIYKMAEGKVQVDIWNGNKAQKTQDDKINLLIKNKVNSLVINLVDITAANTTIEKAKKANIPVVFINREPTTENMQKWDKVYYVGSKAEQSGIIQGQIIVNYFKNHSTKDGVIRYVILKGEQGNQDAELRTKYSVKTIEDAGFKVKKVAEDIAMWDRTKAQEKITSVLTDYGENFDCVISNNDDMALGAIDALKLKGYFNNGKYMPVVGVDATVPALKALEDGTLLGTALNDSVKQGDAGFTLSYILAKGQNVDKKNFNYTITDGKYVWIDYKMITKENINDAR